MAGRILLPIGLSARQRSALEGIARRHTSAQRLVRRARIVLAASDGHSNEQISRMLGVYREAVRTWRGRWLAASRRLASLESEADEKALRAVVEQVLSDEPRSGAPATFTPEQVVRIVAIACEDPSESGRPVTHWSTPELAEEAIKRGIVEKISPRTVGRFLGRGGPEAASGAPLDEQRAGGGARGL
jgi:putative transposase